MLEDLLTEWFTGRDAEGKESVRFAKRWRNAKAGPFASRVYEPHVDDLVPDATLTAAHGLLGMSARLAIGADGAVELRVELERASGREVVRWRPLVGDIAIAFERGFRGKEVVSTARVSEMIAADQRSMTLDDTGPAISVLKRRRFELLDQLEAGGDAQTELSQVDTKLADIRVEHDRLNVERKIAALEKAIDDTIDETQRDNLSAILTLTKQRLTTMRGARG